MGGSDDSSAGWDDVSGPAWSNGSIGPPSDEGVSSKHPFYAEESTRYEHRTTLGWGGMGKVVATRDRRLHRDVAFKQVSAVHGQTSVAATRLAQEAWITAQLEHPNIVPVYDCGHTEDGALFYTMRLIRGRTMHAAIIDSPELSERLGGLRSYLAVCEAMAYAHSVGIVHRDLKPSNIMVGAFGETQVVDWGLARPVGDTQAARATLPMGHLAQTLDGAIVGTAAYMSPEQANAQPPRPTDDVWSLGVVLYELLTGQAAYSGSSHDEVLARVREEQVHDPRDIVAMIPPELSAVVLRATATEPADRYADAKGLADDVAAFLDGRWVTAHHYSAWDLVRRFGARWRAALVVGAAALMVLLAVAGVAFQRTAAQRDRAVAAEIDSRTTTARTLASQASRALRDGDGSGAERLAIAALRLAEVPSARGVLAGAHYPVRLERLPDRELPGCTTVRSSPGGEGVLCLTETDMIWLDTDTLSERWSVPGQAAGSVLTNTSVRLRGAFSGDLVSALIDVETGDVSFGGEENFRWRAGDMEVSDVDSVRIIDGVRTRLPALAPRVGATSPDGRRIAVAMQGGLLIVERDTIRRFPLGDDLSYVLWTEPDAIWATTWRGDLLRIALEGDENVRIAPGIGPLVELRMVDGVAAVRSERGVVAVLDTAFGLQRALVPAGDAQAIGFDGELLRLYSPDREVTYRVPADARPGVFIAPGGVTSVAPSPDGNWLAIGGSEGLDAIHLADGLHQRYPWTPNMLTVKDVAWSRGGELMSVGVIGPLTRWTTAFPVRGEPVPSPRFDVCCTGRRLAVLNDGEAIIGTYHQGHARLKPGQEPRLVSQMVGDVEARADGAEAIALHYELPQVLSIDAQDTRVLFEHAGDVVSVAISVDGKIIALGTAEVVRLRSRDGALIAELPHVAGMAVDLAWSPDGRWLAMGGGDGSAWLWEGKELRAIFAGHSRKVAAVGFLPDSSAVFTGSWDSGVRLWSIEAVDAPLSDLESRTEALWGPVGDEMVQGLY